MPVTKSAKKKLRQDKKRTVQNRMLKDALKDAVKKAQKNPSDDTLRVTTKLADKAAKNHLIHKNKAARIKSRLAKLLGTKSIAKTSPAKTKKSAK